MCKEVLGRFSAPFWTPKRRELLKWLEEAAPPLAELYEGAVHLAFGTPLPGRMRMVCHAVREIRNGLPGFLSVPQTAPASAGRVDDNHLNNLVDRWEKDRLPLDGTLPLSIGTAPGTPGSRSGVEISRRLFRHVAGIVRRHRGRETKLEVAVRLFRAIAPEGEKLGDALRPIALQWADRTEWFMERTHSPRKVGAKAEESELQPRFEEIEAVLMSVIGPIVQTLEEVRGLVEEANS